MPQTTGGSSTKGLKKRRMNSRYSAVKAGEYDRPAPKPNTNKVAQAALNLDPQDIARSSSLGDVAKQVYTYPGRLYEGAEEKLGGLADLAVAMFRGKTDPLMAGEEMLHGTLDAWSNPVDYANEDPLGFLMDASAVGGAAGLADNALFKGRMAPEGPQAIGAIGKRLEAGEVPSSLRYEDPLAPMNSAASMPLEVSGYFGDDFNRFAAKVDPDPKYKIHPLTKERIEVQNQALAEQAAADLNLAGGELVKAPGMMRADIPVSDRLTKPGTLMEYVENLKKVEDPDELNYANPEVRYAMRGQNILDRIIGNNDRFFGANMHAIEGPEGDLLPVAIDQGYGFRRGDRTGAGTVDSFYDNNAWSGYYGDRTLRPEEYFGIKQMLAAMEKPTGALSQMNLRSAIERAREMLFNEEFPEPGYIKSQWHG